MELIQLALDNTNTSRSDEFGNLGFDANEVSLLSVGIGGATVSRGRKCIFDNLPF